MESKRFLEIINGSNSSFLTNYSQFKYIKALLKKHKKKYIHIWSFPCASGEEPFSLAMYFDQLKKSIGNSPKFKIYTSRFNHNTFEKARKGIYKEKTILEIPQIYKKTYFKEIPMASANGAEYSISRDIINSVEFFEEDIIKDHSKLPKFDIIVCRNFLFSVKEIFKNRLLEIFKDHLIDMGLLIIGISEMIMNKDNIFKLVDLRNSFYIKNGTHDSSEDYASWEIKQLPRMDRIIKPNLKGELVIKIGHYALINLTSNKLNSSKFAIYGLGSCIALILQDKLKKIYGISHILLPSFNPLKNTPPIRYPHKYADLSIKDLLEKLLSHGAKLRNIKAIIVGGAIFFQKSNERNQNLEMVEKILKSFQIDIEKRDVGGILGRNVIYNTEDNSVWVKKTGQIRYKKI